MMRFNFYFLAILILLSCDNEPLGQVTDEHAMPPVNTSVFSNISSLIEDLKSEPQTFDINDQTSPSVVTGLDGTVINFEANSFTDLEGNPVTSGIVIHLEAYLSLGQMMKNNIQTLSNGQILVTGGSFNLMATDTNDNPLNVNPWSVSAKLPIRTDITGFESGMSLYVGELTTRDGIEQVNWIQGTNSEFRLNEGFMTFYGIDLGLSNCDVLYDMAGEQATQFSVYVENHTSPSNYMIWMFINDFPSVINISSLTDNGLGVKTYEGSIPKGLNATILAIGVDEDNYLKFGTLDVKVEGDDAFSIEVDYGTTEDLSALIDQLGS